MSNFTGRLRLLAIASVLGLSGALCLAASAPARAATTARHASSPIAASIQDTPQIAADTALGFVANFNDSARCLGISGGAKNVPAVLWNCTSGALNQEWHTGGANSAGYVQIVNGDGECLGTAGGNTAPNTQVVGWTCLGTSHPDQYWFIDTSVVCIGSDGPYYPVYNYKSGRVLGVAGNSSANGAPIVIYGYAGACDNQFWGFTG